MVDGPPLSPRRSVWIGRIRIIVIVAIIGFAVWYMLAHTNRDDLLNGLATMNTGWVLAGVGATLAAHLARSIRWRLMIAEGNTIRLSNAFSATIIGYMMNNIIPRSGEVARPYVLSRSESRPMGTLLGTVLAERVIDGITLAIIVAALIVAEPGNFDRIFAGYSRGGIIAAVLVPLALVIGIIVVMVRTRLGERAMAAMVKRLPPRIGGRIRTFPEDFRAGIAVSGWKGALGLMGWTIAIWTGYLLAIYCSSLAFGFDRLYGLGLAGALPLLAVTAIAVAIAPTPGGFGVYHALCFAALTVLYGVPAGKAAAFAAVAHGAPYLVVMITGSLFFFREDLSFGDTFRRGMASTAPRPALTPDDDSPRI
ncbi:MAG: hypothetical protein JWQ98_3069 [Chlorobi bacterium]|nr:hypothetical protein [Chlorobiota bacterium]